MSKALPLLPKHLHTFYPLTVHKFHVVGRSSVVDSFSAACMCGKVKYVTAKP